jgi:hypothetical protein
MERKTFEENIIAMSELDLKQEIINISSRINGLLKDMIHKIQDISLLLRNQNERRKSLIDRLKKL